MSDVIWAAIIAVGGSGIGSLTTYLVTRRSSDVAIATAERQAEVELAKVRGELDRLREQQRQAARSNRQGTYHRMLAVLDRFDMYATGYQAEGRAEYMSTLEEFNFLVGGIHLFGAQGVRDALSDLSAEMAALGARISNLSAAQRQQGIAEDPYPVLFSRAYQAGRESIIGATAVLTEAMRTDVMREILD